MPPLIIAALGTVIYALIGSTAVSVQNSNQPVSPAASNEVVTPSPTEVPPTPAPTETPEEPGLIDSLLNRETQAAEMPEERISGIFTSTVQYWNDDIIRWSKEHEMDPDLIATIMQIESCGNDRAVSFSGVRGLFQVTGQNMGGLDPYNPDHAMAKGPGKVLKDQLAAANGDIRAAFAGYNGGPWARQWIAGEISRDKFIANYRSHPSGRWRALSSVMQKVNEVERYAQWSNIYFEAKDGQTETLTTWLDIGGGRMCNEAAAHLGLPPVHQ